MVHFEHFSKTFFAQAIFLESISSPFCHNMKITVKIEFCKISTKGAILQNIL